MLLFYVGQVGHSHCRLSLLQLNEMEARYAYHKLAELIRHKFANPLKSLSILITI